MKENKEAKYYEKVMNSTLIVQEYIFYSEMEGELDYDDPWMALYNGLSELRGKLYDEKEFSEMKVAGLSQGDFGKLLDKITKQKEGN